MAITKSFTTCPVCSRKVNAGNAQKGDISYEDVYCSKYCRAYDEQNLSQVPFKNGNKHHNNREKWPKIEVPCQLCDNTLTLKHTMEKRNRSFCSTDCWQKLNSCQTRGVQRTLNILEILHHQRAHIGDSWIEPSAISEKFGNRKTGCSSMTVSLLMKRWRKAGIIEIKMMAKSYSYRFCIDGLKGMKVSEFVYHWNTMSYAERMAFTQS